MKPAKSSIIVTSLIALCALYFSSNAKEAVAAEINELTDETVVWLDTLDINRYTVMQEWGTAKANKSCIGNPITIAGKVFERGIGTHVRGKMKIDLFGEALRFHAWVGVDDEVNTDTSTINFEVYADGKKIYDSGVMKEKTPAKFIDLDITGVRFLILYSNVGGDRNRYDHADWADAKIIMKEDARNKPVFSGRKPENDTRLYPALPDTPKINGPAIIGAGLGRDILYYIPTTGRRPIKFSVRNLPEGLVLDPDSGIITGRIQNEGSYILRIQAENELGKAERDIEFAIGPTLALTPPMGWNSWNVWGAKVDDAKIRAAADAFVSLGLINHGWSYINIDDCWQIDRDKETGEIICDPNFPDMKGLADYVHSKGLKFGLYTSIASKTCQLRPGSLGFYEKDVTTYSDWGADYVKVDWLGGNNPFDAYARFGDAIKKASKRDMVYSICNWGLYSPWEWGEKAGGNLWRITGDINDEWEWVKEIGFTRSAGLSKYAKPGHWNDPDMLVVGYIGWGENMRYTSLTINQQYTHITQWALLSAPLLLGCDLTKIDDLTLSMLTNDEVIAVNQDRLGKQADRIAKSDVCEVWLKELHDGSIAVGIFAIHGDKFTIEDCPEEVIYTLNWEKLGIKGKRLVRDLWRQKDLGVFEKSIALPVPFYDGCRLVKLSGSDLDSELVDITGDSNLTKSFSYR